MRVPGLRQLTQTGINNLAQWDIPCRTLVQPLNSWNN